LPRIDGDRTSYRNTLISHYRSEGGTKVEFGADGLEIQLTVLALADEAIE
jgi:hypothetical protein